MRKEYIEDIQDEVWIKTSGYEISNMGRIITKLGKLSKGTITKHGYVSAHVTFDDGFIARSVHRAVAYAFIGKPPNEDDDINHIDGIKTNNCVENLEWVTHKQNMQHRSDVLGCMVGTDNPINKLTEYQVREIYNLCKDGKMKYKDIAKVYGVIPEEVNKISSCTIWKHLKLEPLPRLIRGSRSRGQKVLWINKDKEYPSMSKCSEDLRNTYNLIINSKIIADICKGNLLEYKEQQFKWA